MDSPDLYLSDGYSQIDYVIVYSNKNIKKRRYFGKIFEQFLAQLDEMNVNYEVSSSVENEDLRYLKIHVSSLILEEYAKIHNIELTYRSKTPEMKEYLYWCRCLHTILSLPDPKNPILKRYRSVTGGMESPLTQAERILLTNIILAHVKFGKRVDEQGVDRILNIGIFKAAFPLHEGNTKWSDEGPLTERQLLSYYWVGLMNMAKIQPLAAIEKYFGPEMAFLYAYLQLTTEMQLLASVLGILLYIIGISVESETSVSIRKYICSSEKLMCPTCDPKYCKFRRLNTYCGLLFRLNESFDNMEMFVLGIFITLWGTIFLEIWKRRQTLYRLRWNLSSLETDLEIRTGYEKGANLLVVSPFTYELEPTMSKADVAFRSFISAASVILLICVVFCLEILVIMMKMQLKISIDNNDLSSFLHRNLDAVVSMVGSSATVLVILIIDLVYKAVSKILTDWENPRTQKQYDNSFMMKCFLFAFANNYTMVFYIAFFKGKFYTNPGDETMHDIRGVYMADTCNLGECDSDLAVQVMCILGIKHLFFKCIGRYLFRMSLVVWNQYKRKKKSLDIEHPQWERDYILKSFDRYAIMKQYIEIILRHGLVLFFTSVCPFTPILTVIVNILEMKLYSHAYIHFYRRPIPRKVEGIEMFYFILQALTWFGVTVNAILALMTKDFAKSLFYMASVNNNITAYMDKRFAAFSMDDFKTVTDAGVQNEHDHSICFFPGNRFPPDHPKKYEEHVELHEYHAFGWMLILIYLHAVFLLTRIIAYLIPDSSSEVNDYVNSVDDENRKDIRRFRNQQFTSTKSIQRSLQNIGAEKMEEKQTDGQKSDE